MHTANRDDNQKPLSHPLCNQPRNASCLFHRMQPSQLPMHHPSVHPTHTRTRHQAPSPIPLSKKVPSIVLQGTDVNTQRRTSLCKKARPDIIGPLHELTRNQQPATVTWWSLIGCISPNMKQGAPRRHPAIQESVGAWQAPTTPLNECHHLAKMRDPQTQPIHGAGCTRNHPGLMFQLPVSHGRETISKGASAPALWGEMLKNPVRWEYRFSSWPLHCEGQALAAHSKPGTKQSQ